MESGCRGHETMNVEDDETDETTDDDAAPAGAGAGCLQHDDDIERLDRLSSDNQDENARVGRLPPTEEDGGAAGGGGRSACSGEAASSRPRRRLSRAPRSIRAAARRQDRTTAAAQGAAAISRHVAVRTPHVDGDAIGREGNCDNWNAGVAPAVGVDDARE